MIVRNIATIVAEGESVSAEIQLLRIQLHDAEKRLASLQNEADRAVRATFRGASAKPKNTRVTGGQLVKHLSVNGAGETADGS